VCGKYKKRRDSQELAVDLAVSGRMDNVKERRKETTGEAEAMADLDIIR
jgi:hypothetical protein